MRLKANLAGIGFSIIFGCSFLASKILLKYISPLGLIALRFLLAFILFEILRLSRAIKVDFSLKTIKSLWWIVLLQPVLYFIFETYALRLTSTSQAGIMIATIPVIVAILAAIFLKEKLSLLQIIFIIISISGVILIQVFNDDAQDNKSWVGFILLIGAMLSAAFFNIFSRKASKNYSPITITYFMVLGACIIFNIAYLIESIINSSLKDYFAVFLIKDAVLALMYLGFLSSILAFFLVNYSLSILPAPISSLYSNFSTIVAIIVGVIFLDEKLSPIHYIGFAMIIMGVYLSIVLSPKQIEQKVLN